MSQGIFLQTFVVRNQGDLDQGIHISGFDLDYHIKKVISDCGVTLDCPCSDCGNGFSASEAPGTPVPAGILAIDEAAAGPTPSFAHSSEVPEVDPKLLQAAITMLASQVAALQAEVASLKAE